MIRKGARFKGFKRVDFSRVAIGVILCVVYFLEVWGGFWAVRRLKGEYESYYRIMEVYREVEGAEEEMKGAARGVEDVRDEWLRVIKGSDLALWVEGGLFLKTLGDLAERFGIDEIEVDAREKEIGFQEGHFRSVPYDVRMKGEFTGVYGVLKGLEDSRIPLEVKPLKITRIDLQGGVGVEATVVLYSLNPPTLKVLSEGDVGKNNPFYSGEIEERYDRARDEEDKEKEGNKGGEVGGERFGGQFDGESLGNSIGYEEGFSSGD